MRTAFRKGFYYGQVSQDRGGGRFARPFQALTFVWNTLKPCDMVTVGTLTPDEAKELIDLSMQILDRQPAEMKLQETRSKAAVKPRATENVRKQ